jgi:hypothetical protein
MRCGAAPLGRILAGAPAVYLRGVENVLDPTAQSLRRHPLGLPNRRQAASRFHQLADPKSSRSTRGTPSAAICGTIRIAVRRGA